MSPFSGEVLAAPFSVALHMCQPRPGECFLDLGCGVGKAVLLAALMPPAGKTADGSHEGWKRVWGIELVAQHVHHGEPFLREYRKLYETKASQRAQRANESSCKRPAALHMTAPSQVEVIVGDFTQVSWTDEADVVFIAGM